MTQSAHAPDPVERPPFLAEDAGVSSEFPRPLQLIAVCLLQCNCTPHILFIKNRVQTPAPHCRTDQEADLQRLMPTQRKEANRGRGGEEDETEKSDGELVVASAMRRKRSRGVEREGTSMANARKAR